MNVLTWFFSFPDHFIKEAFEFKFSTGMYFKCTESRSPVTNPLKMQLSVSTGGPRSKREKRERNDPIEISDAEISPLKSS